MTAPPAHLTAALADRYTVDAQIGAGGMATVYRARDLRHDRDVAIKVLRPDIADALGRERFVREIRLAARLTHPHILPLYDSGEADGALFFVMPIMEGQSLRALMDSQGRLPVDVATRIAGEVADALDYAHRNDVVHRDTDASIQAVEVLRSALEGADQVFTTGLVLQELLQGFPGPKARHQLIERFTALAFLQPDRDDHIEAAEIRNICRRNGVPIGIIDAVLLQLCVRHDLILLSADQHVRSASKHVTFRLWGGDA